MSKSELEKAVEEIRKDIETLKSLKEEVNSTCGKAEEKTKDRAFEIKKIKVESYISNGNTYLTLLTGIAFSLWGVLYALSGSIVNSLTSPTIITGNFTNGNSTWTGQLNTLSLPNSSYFTILTYVDLILVIVGFLGLFGLIYFHKVVTPKKINELRNFPLDSETAQ